jgi:hypothetical protein
VLQLLLKTWSCPVSLTRVQRGTVKLAGSGLLLGWAAGKRAK